MRGARRWLFLLGAGMAATVGAQDSNTPDLGFLEYLGSWQEGDEEWLVVAGMGDELESEQDSDEDGDSSDEAGDSKPERPKEDSDED